MSFVVCFRLMTGGLYDVSYMPREPDGDWATSLARGGVARFATMAEAWSAWERHRAVFQSSGRRSPAWSKKRFHLLKITPEIEAQIVAEVLRGGT